MSLPGPTLYATAYTVINTVHMFKSMKSTCESFLWLEREEGLINRVERAT